MQISVFPVELDPTPHPVKSQNLTVNSVKELADTITRYKYSGATFKENARKNANFIQTELIILDYDNYPTDKHVTLADARAMLKDYKHILAPTKSHQTEKNGHAAADRFRVVLFLAKPITDEATFGATWRKVADMFPGCDKAVKDVSRYLVQSTFIESHSEKGKLIDVVTAPVKIKKPVEIDTIVPREDLAPFYPATIEFLTNGAPDGSWNRTLYKAAKDFQEQQYTREEFESAAIKITGELDAEDMTTIDSAYRRAPMNGPRVRRDMSKVEMWVRDTLNELNPVYSYRGETLRIGGKSVGSDEIIADLILEAKRQSEQTTITDERGKEKPAQMHDKFLIQISFDKWFREQSDTYVQSVRDAIMWMPDVRRDGIRQWVRAVTGREDEKDVAVMTHFIWQVKRKLMGLKVDNHMMPIIYGPTGSGKTRAITALLNPIREVVNEPQDMTVLGEERSGKLFQRFYVIFFDEMANASKVDVSAMKKKITGEDVTYRKLGTNNHANKDNVSTFIGATNDLVKSIIKDTTSARRFWQIDSLNQIDWQTINTIDYLAMWRSVDEQEICPIIPYIDEIKNVQNNELKYDGHIEDWFKTQTEILGADDLTHANDAYFNFKSWIATQVSNNPTTILQFALELKRLGVAKVKRGGKAYYQLKLKNPKQDPAIAYA